MSQTPHAIGSGSDGFLKSQSIVSETKSVYAQDDASLHPRMVGRIRFHYDEVVSSCNYLLLLGVGTFMSVSDYDNLSRALTYDQNLVVAVIDHNVQNLEKTSSTKFASLVHEIIFQISSLIPICTRGQAKLLIGGHSASGEAAMNAWHEGLLSALPRETIGFIGLDPYEISNKTMPDNIIMSLPGLYWGFTTTTCLVEVQKAARAAYNKTVKDARVLYVIHNEKHDSQTSHCVFTDKGCGFIPLGCGTTSSASVNSVYGMVAESVQLFLQGLNHLRPFNHDTFMLPDYSGEKVDLFVNGDQTDYEEQKVSFVS